MKKILIMVFSVMVLASVGSWVPGPSRLRDCQRGSGEDTVHVNSVKMLGKGKAATPSNSK